MRLSFTCFRVPSLLAWRIDFAPGALTPTADWEACARVAVGGHRHTHSPHGTGHTRVTMTCDPGTGPDSHLGSHTTVTPGRAPEATYVGHRGPEEKIESKPRKYHAHGSRVLTLFPLEMQRDAARRYPMTLESEKSQTLDHSPHACGCSAAPLHHRPPHGRLQARSSHVARAPSLTLSHGVPCALRVVDGRAHGLPPCPCGRVYSSAVRQAVTCRKVVSMRDAQATKLPRTTPAMEPHESPIIRPKEVTCPTTSHSSGERPRSAPRTRAEQPM